MTEALEFVEVGGKQYRVIKTGRAQAEQALGLVRWISKHGAKAMQSITPTDGAEKKVGAAGGIEFLAKFIDALDADALIDLFTVLVGCPPEDSEVYFDIAILVDLVMETYNHQQSLRRLIDRFFSSGNSIVASEAVSSTTSE
jgi:hypothetical protein